MKRTKGIPLAMQFETIMAPVEGDYLTRFLYGIEGRPGVYRRAAEGSETSKNPLAVIANYDGREIILVPWADCVAELHEAGYNTLTQTSKTDAERVAFGLGQRIMQSALQLMESAVNVAVQNEQDRKSLIEGRAGLTGGRVDPRHPSKQIEATANLAKDLADPVLVQSPTAALLGAYQQQALEDIDKRIMADAVDRQEWPQDRAGDARDDEGDPDTELYPEAVLSDPGAIVEPTLKEMGEALGLDDPMLGQSSWEPITTGGGSESGEDTDDGDDEGDPEPGLDDEAEDALFLAAQIAEAEEATKVVETPAAQPGRLFPDPPADVADSLPTHGKKRARRKKDGEA
jgi:hypothetical protein